MLLQEAKKGCEEAFIKLFYQYRPIIYRVQGKYSIKDFDREDWMQVGRIVLQESIEKYQETRSTTFGVFFRTNFENRIKSYLRYQHASKRQAHAEAVSLEEKLAYDGTDFLNQWMSPSAGVLSQLMIEEAVEDVRLYFSSFEQEVLSAYIRGKELKEIAEEKELPFRKVRGAYDRAKSKLIKHIQENSV